MKLEYLRPQDFLPSVSFQSLSNDEFAEVKKLGDPPGYCLAWSFWYIDTRMSNPNIHPKDIFDLTNKKIVEYMKEINEPSQTINEKIFISYIRNYAKSLNDIKDSYLLKMGIKKEHLYDLILQPSDYVQVRKQLAALFTKIINKNFIS